MRMHGLDAPTQHHLPPHQPSTTCTKTNAAAPTFMQVEKNPASSIITKQKEGKTKKNKKLHPMHT
jgi:hypothetical protein